MAEQRSVSVLMQSAQQYADLERFSETCKAWLWRLICMGPDSVLVELKDDQLLKDQDPLSPSSSSLRSKVPLVAGVTGCIA